MLYAGGLVGLLLFAFWVYCLLDVLTTDGSAVRNLPKLAWFAVVLLLWWVGGLVWLFAGRPTGTSLQAGTSPATNRRPPTGSGSVRWRPPAARPPAPLAPDDDPEFLRRLGRANRERRDDDPPPPEPV